jgi:lysozyme
MNRDLLIADLRVAEGVKNVCYDDATGEAIGPGSHVVGHPTIGIGRRCDQPWSAAIIEFLLDDSIRTTCVALDQAVPWWRTLTDAQQRALVELAFTMGVTGVMRCHRLLLALKSGHGAAAACELLNARWTTQVGETRANRVADQLKA